MSPSTHFIGIGGTGLSAIARVLLERGEAVTGSDREESATMEGLRAAGAKISLGHAAGNVNGATRVVRSSAITDDNVEVQAAQAKGIPVLKRADLLGDLLAGKRTIAVAGSHGKTTTTAMLAWMLTALGEAPGYIIGSVAENLGSNASAGAGELFVIEADEYDYMFLGLNPYLALVTNVEHDHPDMFPTPKDFEDAFARFVERLPAEGVLLGCADDAGARALLGEAGRKGRNVRSYSLYADDADYSAKELTGRTGQGFAFDAYRDKEQFAQVELEVPGEHNAQNALGALAAVDVLGLPVSEAAQALAEFRGTGRRFELRGEAGGVLLIDDYAHHPTEIRASLAAAKVRYPQRRLWALWQPHTFSRTLTLLDAFAQAFSDADEVVVTGVYAARELPPKGFEMRTVLERIEHKSLQHAADLEEAKAFLLSHLIPGDVLMVLSAGDAIELSASLYEELKAKE